MMFRSKSTDNPSAQAQLDKVKLEFEQWRSQKKTAAEKIPLNLLLEAQKLTEHFKASEVRRRLGLSKAQMDKLNDGFEQVPEDTGSTTDFMRLVPAQQSSDREVKVEVSTAEGVKICLTGLSEQDPLAIIGPLISRGSAC